MLYINPRVSKEEDEFIRNAYENRTRWIITLNNGEKIYQDDDRPGETDSAWTRVKQYCKKNKLYIIGMALQFRSHVISLPDYQYGYFFCNSARGMWGSDKTYHFFVTGIVKYENQNEVFITKYKIPELIIDSTEIRDINKCHECLITRQPIIPTNLINEKNI